MENYGNRSVALKSSLEIMEGPVGILINSSHKKLGKNWESRINKLKTKSNIFEREKTLRLVKFSPSGSFLVIYSIVPFLYNSISMIVNTTFYDFTQVRE